MDYIIVDVSKIKYGDIKVGDWVELIGKNISLDYISKKANTIPYEILNSIGNRVKNHILTKNENLRHKILCFIKKLEIFFLKLFVLSVKLQFFLVNV